MTKRIAILVTLVLSLVALPGCPGAEGLGVWGFLPEGNSDLRGLDLRASGSAVQVALSNANFAGTLTWEQITASEILIRQNSGADSWIFYFRLTSGTSMKSRRV